MDAKTYLILFLVLPFATCEWRQYQEDPRSLREARKEIHYHSKRHMLPRESERRRSTTQRTKDVRKKPSGHLRPLHEDDMENDEVVSVAIGPPASRPKYERTWKPPQPSNNTAATNFVKEVLVQLGREFLSHKVSEEFVFGQYVGNAMKNLTADLKIRMQHEILELVLKYQRMNRNEAGVAQKPEQTQNEEKPSLQTTKEFKEKEKKFSGNETEEGWPDFSNLAKIVG
ncbi:uncharacterized protein [Epargyreus clarus]|uniref:uncharacterized protein n=1 Tax=Epargyreus clarus TaxID=520877 RepID=UPI003C2BBC02